MADNITLDPGGGGAVVKTDDDGTAHWQYVKVAYGADNTQTRVTDSAPLPVELTDGTAVIAKAEDSAHTTGDSGFMSLGVRSDTLAALAGTTGDYSPYQVDADGAVYVHDQNLIDTNNSTTTPLGGAATFTGTGTDVSQYAAITITLYADVDSAASGMQFQFSTDNTNWDDVYSFTLDVSASDTRRFQFPTTAQYFRVVYTNGAGAQTAFRVQTILHAQTVATSIHRLADNVDPDRSASVNKSAIIAQSGGTGDFIPLTASTAGYLRVSLAEVSDGADVGAGNVGTETQRVTIATNDVNQSAINTATTTIAGAVQGTEMQVDLVGIGDVATQTTLASIKTDTGTMTIDLASLDAKFASSATLSDNFANPTSTTVGSFGMLWDGATWDRMPGTSADGVTVNLGSNNDVTLATLPDTASSDLATTAAGFAAEGSALGSGVLLQGDDGTDRKNINVDATTGDVQVDVTNTVTVDLGANNDIQGDVAHDSADSGNPVKVGGKAKNMDGTAPGTDVAEDDRVDMIATVDGRQFVETTHPNFWHTSADYASAQTNATVKAAPGAGLKLYITDVIVSNGATAGNVTLLDGSGGTVLLELYPAINGGLTHSFRTPLALTANTLLAITSTTVTTHSVTVSGFIAA
jgi:hypothetical protein